jgi:hypothetical protein
MRDALSDGEQLMANLPAALTLANEFEMRTLAYLIETRTGRSPGGPIRDPATQKPPTWE